MKIEILCGGNIEKAFKELDIPMTVTYSGEQYKVCEIEKSDLKIISEISESEWKPDWGWWRFAKGSNMGTPYEFFVVNGQMLIGWISFRREDLYNDWEAEDNAEKAAYHYSFKEYEEDIMPREYNSLSQYLCEELGASQPRNICALAIDLAKANGMTMAKLFATFEGGTISKV